MTLPHEILHYHFPVEHALAVIRLPREGIKLADAERMAEMVKAVVVEDARQESGSKSQS